MMRPSPAQLAALQYLWAGGKLRRDRGRAGDLWKGETNVAVARATVNRLENRGLVRVLTSPTHKLCQLTNLSRRCVRRFAP